MKKTHDSVIFTHLEFNQLINQNVDMIDSILKCKTLSELAIIRENWISYLRKDLQQAKICLSTLTTQSS